MALLLWLTSLGAVFELLGIGFGAWAIISRGRQLRTFETTFPDVLSTGGEAHSFARMIPTAKQDLSVEERVAALETQLQQQRTELEQQIGTLHEAAVNYTTAKARDVEANIDSRLSRIQTLLRDLADDGASAKLALLFLLLGLGLQTTSNLLQILHT